MFSITKRKSDQLQADFYGNLGYTDRLYKLSTILGLFEVFQKNFLQKKIKNLVFRQIFYEKMRRFLFFENFCLFFN